MSNNYNNENDYQALAGWLTTRLDQWRNHRDNNYLKQWDEYYRLWRGIWSMEDRTRQSEKSKLISPALQQAVESSVAEIEEATFGRGKWFDIKDDMLDKEPQDVEYVRNLLQEDLEAAGVKDALCEVFLNGAIYGTGIGKIITEEKIEKKPTEQPVPGTLTSVRQIEEYTTVEVKVEAISPKEFLIDPSAESINEALGVAHEVYKPRYILSEGMDKGVYRNIDIEADTDVVQVGFDPEYINRDAGDQIKITEYWGKVPKKFLNKKKSEDDFEYNEDELVEAVVTLANDEYILRAEENPFMMVDRPFISYQHDIVPSKFWGRGVCEKGFNPQKALDAEMRARIDSLALTTTPMIAADATRLPRGIKLEVRPGKTILTNGDPKQAIMPLTLGNTDQNTYNQVATLQNMIQMGTGSTDAGAGAERATSSGMSMQQSASIKRQKRTLMNFQNTFLIPMINKSMWRKIQFDVERYPIADYKFIPYSTMGIMAKELEMQQMVSMLQSIPKDSPAFNVLLLAVFQNSSMHNRDQVVQGLMQGMQPNPEQQQMQQMQIQLQMEQAKADIQKTLAEAQEEQAKAIKHQADAGTSQPNQLDIQERLVKLQKELANIDKVKADTQSTRTDTFRTIPEMEHLESETALNYANAQRSRQQGILPQ
jgi:hypothetical protein